MDGLIESGGGFPGWGDVPFGARAAMLARNWWAVALRGALGVAFGLMALAWPGVTLSVLVLLFGAYMAVDGIFAIIAAARALAHHERWGMLIVEGIVDLIAAAIAFAAPIITLLAFIYLLGAWAIISGVLLGWASFRLHPAHGRWLMTIGALVSIVWGALLFAMPIAGALVMAWWIGAYAIVFGVVLLVFAFRLRRLHRGTV